jgi:hypothetical protein
MTPIFSRPRDTTARLVEPRPVDRSNHDRIDR